MGNEKKPAFDRELVERFVQSVEDYAELDPEATQSEEQLVINWGKKGCGFGMLVFYEKDGAFWVDNETMGKPFCKAVLERLIANPNVPTPPLLARFQTIDALLDASTPVFGEW